MDDPEHTIERPSRQTSLWILGRRKKRILQPCSSYFPMLLVIALLLSASTACEDGASKKEGSERISKGEIQNRMAPRGKKTPDEALTSLDEEPNDVPNDAMLLPWPEDGSAILFTGEISKNGQDIDHYLIPATEVERVSLRLIPLSPEENLSLTLSSPEQPSKQALFDGAGPGAGEMIPGATLGPRGLLLKVSDSGSRGGRYQIEVIRASPNLRGEAEPNDLPEDASIVLPGAATSAWVNQAGDQDHFFLSTPGEKPFDFELRAPATLPIEVRLKREGEDIWQDRLDAGETKVFRFLKATPKGYSLIVRSETLTSRPVSYSIKMSPLEGAGPFEEEPNNDGEHAQQILPSATLQKLQGAISSSEDTDHFKLQIPASDSQKIFSVRLLPSKKLDVSLRSVILEQSLEEVHNENGLGGTEALCNVALRDGATIELLVSSKKGEGNYTLELLSRDALNEEIEPNPIAETATKIASKQTLSGYIHPRRDIDVFRFEVSPSSLASRRVELTLAKGYAANLILALKDDQFDDISIADKTQRGGAERLSADLPAGTYYAVVRSHREASCQEPYQLSLSVDGEGSGGILGVGKSPTQDTSPTQEGSSVKEKRPLLPPPPSIPGLEDDDGF